MIKLVIVKNITSRGKRLMKKSYYKIVEFLTKVNEKQDINKNLNVVEKKFSPLKISSGEAQKLVCAVQSEPIFFDDDNFYRLLSLHEILDAESDMKISFKKLGVLPLIDCGDNEFLCYDLKNHNWCKFNIADEFKYSTKKSIFDYFN